MPSNEAGPAHALFKKRPLWLLLAVSFVLGAVHALTILPLPLILGYGPFWEFPSGTVPGSFIDLAQSFAAYLYLVQAPWTVPLLYVADLVPPIGRNTFWLDPVPWVGLVGKAIFSATGVCLNLLGIFLFFCFLLPGVAMTVLFWVAGRRGLIFAIAGSLLANSMPLMLFEWGHVSLSAHCLLIFALALYLLTQRYPADMRVVAGWLALLAIAALTHMYLFVMVGGCWTAALVQKGLDRRASARRLAVEASATIGTILIVMLVTGVLDSNLGSGGTNGFGVSSMNLGSPVISQLSGAIPPLRTYWIGMPDQVFDYFGLGVLIMFLISIPGMARYFSKNARSHLAITCVFIAFYLFALSNKITLGSDVLLDIPLPDRLAHALGAFRASGRFFWPIAYAILALSILVVTEKFHSRTALAILGIACILQLVDAGPVRNAVAETARHPLTAVLDRQRADELINSAQGLMIFPSAGCIPIEGDLKQPRYRQPYNHLLQAAVELGLLAARHNLPINSAVSVRVETDCAAEMAIKQRPLRTGIEYFYLTPFTPSAAQLGGHDLTEVCKPVDWFKVCRFPP